MDPVLHLYVLGARAGIDRRYAGVPLYILGAFAEVTKRHARIPGSDTGIPFYVPGSRGWVPVACADVPPEDEVGLYPLVVFFRPTALNVDAQIGGEHHDKSDADSYADDDGAHGRLLCDARFRRDGDAVLVGVIDATFQGVLIPVVPDKLGGVLL